MSSIFRLRNVRVHALLPGGLAEGGTKVVDRVLDLPANRGKVDADQAVLALHDPAVHEHGVHVAALSLEHHVAVRVEQRERHGAMVVLEEHQVGFLADLDAAEVAVPNQCAGASG